MALVLRAAIESDIDRLLAIERCSFPESPWKAADFFRYDCVVALAAGGLTGFLVSHQTYAGNDASPPEREILNLAVAPDFRRRGIASALLEHEQKRAAHLFLEVRQSNQIAIDLYQKMGFRQLSLRHAYYSSPVESAIVMSLKW